MLFHYDSKQYSHKVELQCNKYLGFLKKQENPLIAQMSDTQIQFQGVLIGCTWMDENKFASPIEEYSVREHHQYVLLKGSLNLQIYGPIGVNSVQVRKHASHRISLHGKNIVNYHEGTINGKIDNLITKQSYYIDKLNDSIIDDRIKNLDIQIQPKCQYNKVDCIEITADTYCISLIGESQHNLLIRDGKQIPFYQDVLDLEGQISFQFNHFFRLHQNVLYMISSDGIVYQEDLPDHPMLYQGEVLIIQNNNIKVDDAKNTISVSRTIEGQLLTLQLMSKQQKYKWLLTENRVKRQDLIQSLLITEDVKFIKNHVKQLWKETTLKQSELAAIYNGLYQQTNSNKYKAKYRLLQCYQIKSLKISFIDCLQSEDLDVKQLIHNFQKQLIYNYVFTLYLVISKRSELIEYFLPNNQLFRDFEANDEGTLCNSCRLTDLQYLGNDDVPQLKLNYNEIASEVLIKLFGQCRQVEQLRSNKSLEYFLYNTLVKHSNTRLSLQEFSMNDDPFGILLAQTNDMSLLLDQLWQYYQSKQLDLVSELIKQLHHSKYGLQLFLSIMENEELLMLIGEQIVDIIFQRALNCNSNQFELIEQISDAFRMLLINYEQDMQQIVLDKVRILDNISQLQEVLHNFNINYTGHEIQTKLFKQSKQCISCLDQILENHLLNRVKQTQFTHQQTVYNLNSVLDLKLLLILRFKQYLDMPCQIEMAIMKKYLDYGKNREVKQLIQVLQLKPDQIDQVISDSMAQSLKILKKVQNIADQRLIYREIIQDVQKLTKCKLKLAQKQMNIYKFIVESKEVGDYTFTDVSRCNYAIISIFRRTQNIELPYIRMKKLLSKANDLPLYDIEFCQFILDIAKRNLVTNPTRSQLILDELIKNQKYDSISSEISILMLSLHKDDNVRQEHYWKAMTEAKSAEVLLNLIHLNNKKPKLSLSYKRFDIQSMEIMAIPLKSQADTNKVHDIYKQLYNQASEFEVVFYDELLVDSKEAIQLLLLNKQVNSYELIKKVCCTGLFKTELLLQQYLKQLSPNSSLQEQLTLGDIVEDVAQALVISRQYQLFDLKSIFDKQHRMVLIRDRLLTMDLETLVPDLKYFRDFDLKQMKLNIVLDRLRKVNLQEFYINKKDSVKHQIQNSAKGTPEIFTMQFDCPYHFILHEEQLELNDKQKIQVRAMLNQCVLSNIEYMKNWNAIYSQLIKQEDRCFESIIQDLRMVVDTENIFILAEIGGTFFNCKDDVYQIYLTKLICRLQDPNQQEILKKWLQDCPDRRVVSKLRELIQGQILDNPQQQDLFQSLLEECPK